MIKCLNLVVILSVVKLRWLGVLGWEREKERETERETERERERQTDRKRNRERDKERAKHRNRQTKMGKETERDK